MARHTPGPWEARRLDDTWTVFGDCTREFVLPDEKGIIVATIERSRPGYTTPVDAADARLIAAAPELLAALELAQAVIPALPVGVKCRECDPGVDWTCPDCAARQAIRAALAKAGRPPR